MNLSYWCGGSMGCIKLTMKWGEMRVGHGWVKFRNVNGHLDFLKTSMERGEKDIRLIKPKSLDS